MKVLHSVHGWRKFEKTRFITESCE